MEPIGMVVPNLATRGSPSRSDALAPDRALAIRRRASAMPVILNHLTDVVIPRRAMSAWREAGKPRCLRRPLNDDERLALEERRADLEPWVIGFHKAETDEIVVALADMYSAFPSLNSASDQAAGANIAKVMRSIEAYPKWAIERACEKVRTKGYVRIERGNYVTERHWPPSDPELIELIREEATLYADTWRNINEMLTAEVEK